MNLKITCNIRSKNKLYPEFRSSPMLFIKPSGGLIISKSGDNERISSSATVLIDLSSGGSLLRRDVSWHTIGCVYLMNEV